MEFPLQAGETTVCVWNPNCKLEKLLSVCVCVCVCACLCVSQHTPTLSLVLQLQQTSRDVSQYRKKVTGYGVSSIWGGAVSTGRVPGQESVLHGRRDSGVSMMEAGAWGRL